MRRSSWAGPWSIVAAAAAVWIGCVPSPTTSSSSSGSGGTGGHGGTSASSGGGGAGGSTTSSSSSSTSSQGTGGGAPVGQDASETVSAGRTAKNGQYRMVFTLGQPAQNQGQSKNSSYLLQGGLIGKTENK